MYGVFGGILLIGITCGCSILPVEEEVLTPPIVKVSGPVQYDLFTVQRGEIKDEVTFTGSFTVTRRENLYFQQTGARIKGIYVKKGDLVNPDTVVAEILNDQIYEKMQEQRYIVEKREMQYKHLKEKEQADLEIAEQTLVYVSEDLSRGRQDPSATKKTLDGLLKKVVDQEIAIQKMREEYNKKMEESQGQLDLEKVRLQALKNQYEEIYLRPSFTGEVVSVQSKKEGDLLIPSEPLLTIFDQNSKVFSYRGEHHEQFQIGDQVPIQWNMTMLEGVVIARPSEISDENHRADTVYMGVSDLPDSVKHGDSGRIHLIRSQKEDVLLVPQKAVHSVNGEKIVYVLEGEIKEKYVIETGIETRDMVEVVSGLEEGQKVFLN